MTVINTFSDRALGATVESMKVQDVQWSRPFLSFTDSNVYLQVAVHGLLFMYRTLGSSASKLPLT